MPDDAAYVHVDRLLDNDVFKDWRTRCRCGQVRWFYCSPGEPGSQEATLLARRLSQLCKVVHRRGGWWTATAPHGSRIWDFPPYLALATLVGTRVARGQLCGGAGEKILTNAAFLDEEVQERVSSTEGSEMYRHFIRLFMRAVERQPEFAVIEDLVITADGRTGAGEAPSARQERERLNETCVGGLRRARRAVARVPGWRTIGPTMRAAMGGIVARHGEAFERVLDTLGKVDAVAVPDAAVAEARAEIRRILKIDAASDAGSLLQPDIIAALTEASGDPDTAVADWVAHGAPLGITRAVEPAGIFPDVPVCGVGREADRLRYMGAARADGNYSSYEEHRTEADAELRRELEAGFLEWSRTAEELEATVGPLVLAKIAVIVKETNGRKKVRLIHDLRRNGTNGLIRIRERLVLPRLRDVIDEAVEVMHGRAVQDELEFLVLDFKDAFKMLAVHADERRFLAGRAMGGFFCYKSVLFGVGSGPLVWGRVAAWLCRATQALFGDREAALNCYVDDPILLLCGTRARRRLMAQTVLLWWCALGCRLAYPKGQLGPRVSWIGAAVEVDLVRARVMVRIPRDKVDQVTSAIAAFLRGRGMLSHQDLRALAGRVSWMAGLLPQLKPFARQLWAALTGGGAAGKPGLVYLRQVAPALSWLRCCFGNVLGDLVRFVYVVDRYLQGLLLEVDASPWGGGAACWRGVSTRAGRGPPDEYIVARWTPADEELLGVVIGEAAGQAVWEAFMYLLAVRHFVAANTRGRIAVVGDALGVWSGLVSLSARSPAINDVAREVALILAPLGHELTGVHIWSEANALADELSRLDDLGATPAALGDARRGELAPRQASAWQVLGRRLAPAAATAAEAG